MASSFLEFLQVNKHKTFRPKKKFPSGTLRYNLHKQAEASLHSGLDLKSAVRMPANENFDDWLAVHTVDFFNRINLMYGTIAESCTPQSCPTMSGGAKYEYLWQDGERFKKPTKLPAPDYVALLMDWIEVRINDEHIFPSDMSVPFPRDFQQICKKVLTRLFRVFVHVYIHHFDRLVQLGAYFRYLNKNSLAFRFVIFAFNYGHKFEEIERKMSNWDEPHANTCYKHFYFFVTEYNMVSQRELEPLKEMTEKLIRANGRRPQLRQAYNNGR